MGLITGLLTLPLAPVRGVVWMADQIRVFAENELADRDAVRRRLTEIQRAREAGEISEPEAAQLEEEVLAQWRDHDGEGH